MNQDKLLEQWNRDGLIKIIERSTQNLHHRIDMQHYILLSILGHMTNRRSFDLCSLVDCPHKRLLRQVLTEIIETLEETKKAFKSKQLEELRKKLIRVLAESD
jgi:hypothetical protein